jgi:HD-GYP domain-containing protein (c-di-GMP phosphodiesterase class II)
MYLSEISNLNEGIALAKNIYTADNKVLLKSGVKLTPNYINKLKELGVNYVYVQDPRLEGAIEDEEVISEKIKQEAVVIAKECLKGVSMNEGINTLIKPQKIINIIENIIEDIGENKDIIINLRDIRKLEDELFFHLVDVTILSLVLGESLNYNKEELKILGVGSFLHDIGKAIVDPNILNKPDKLSESEFEQVKKHSTYGYNILKSQNNIDEISALAAYQHHERCDGSGYPIGLKKKDIHEFARIVAIADVFDAMKNDRVYRPACKVKEVIEYLYTMMTKNKLDHDLMQNFLKYLTPYPVGTKVKLSNGYEGVVIKTRQHANSRPIVRVLKINGKDLTDPIDIDLNQKVDIVIEDETT